MTLSILYGHKWTSMFPDEASKKVGAAVWGDALAGLSSFQLKRGVDRCKRREGWPPSTGEFLRLACGLPSKVEAVMLVIKKEVCDPLTRNILLAIGSWGLRRYDTKRLARLTASLYDGALAASLDEVIGLEGDWAPPVKISAPAKAEELKRPDPAVVAVKIEELKALLRKPRP